MKEMDFLSLNKLEFENLDNNVQEKKSNVSQEEAIDHSCRIVDALSEKREEHNKENLEVSLVELKDVFRKGSLDCGKENLHIRDMQTKVPALKTVDGKPVGSCRKCQMEEKVWLK